MVVARREVVIDGVEGGYHVVSRCVRRAFLCGEDEYSGKSYEHRKEWVRSRLEVLAGGFAIEVCAYAVMSNHLHLVLRTRPDWPENWTEEEMAGRWLTIFPKRRDFVQSPKPPNKQEIGLLANDRKKMAKIRERLSSVSWFMRCLNEYIARRANFEDGCKGRFWEGRFKCQALLDESAYLAAMAYVDLNPIRVGISQAPEDSEFTSANDRIVAKQAQEKLTSFSTKIDSTLTPKQIACIHREEAKLGRDQWLCPIGSENHNGQRGILPMDITGYIDILDWTGRLIREDKRGAIPAHLAPILERLEIDTENWINTVQNYGGLFFRAVGKIDAMVTSAQTAGKRWWQGIKACRQAFSSA